MDEILPLGSVSRNPKYCPLDSYPGSRNIAPWIRIKEPEILPLGSESRNPKYCPLDPYPGTPNVPDRILFNPTLKRGWFRYGETTELGRSRLCVIQNCEVSALGS